jgi:hypothetical protein
MASTQNDEETIKELIYAFIATLKSRDRAFMESTLLPGFSAQLIRNGTILRLKQEEFLDRLPWDWKQEVEEVLTSIDVKVS